MKLDDLWVLRHPGTKRLLTCAEVADPIALFTSESQAKEHQDYYEAAEDYEPAKLADCLQ